MKGTYMSDEEKLVKIMYETGIKQGIPELLNVNETQFLEIIKDIVSKTIDDSPLPITRITIIPITSLEALGQAIHSLAINTPVDKSKLN
jgi:hypothetical protein